jgi:hypothetical protein
MVLRLLSSPLLDVTDRTELNNLVGQKNLHAFDDDHYGWYIGTITGTNLGAREEEEEVLLTAYNE